MFGRLGKRCMASVIARGLNKYTSEKWKKNIRPIIKNTDFFRAIGTYLFMHATTMRLRRGFLFCHWTVRYFPPQLLFLLPTRFSGDLSNKRTSKLGTTMIAIEPSSKNFRIKFGNLVGLSSFWRRREKITQGICKSSSRRQTFKGVCFTSKRDLNNASEPWISMNYGNRSGGSRRRGRKNLPISKRNFDNSWHVKNIFLGSCPSLIFLRSQSQSW